MKDLETIDKIKTTQLQLFAPSEITRPDANIGKWAGWIFASPWAKGLYESKEFNWVTTVENEEVKASINIRPINGRKRPTSTSYKVFLALTQVWEQSGKPQDGEIFFSARQLAEILGYKGFSEKTANRIQEQLDILTNTSISWLFSYKKKTGLEEQYSDMHLIESNTYFKKENTLKKNRFKRSQQVRLNKDLVRNMLDGHTKPVNYKAFISIKNDSSANLYTLLDIFLSKKQAWERLALPLLTEDLELTGERYKKRNLRLAKLKSLAKELDGKELSTGKLQLKIKRSSDGTDYKLVASKIPRKTKDRIPPIIANSDEDIPLIVEDILEGLASLGSISEVSEGVLKSLAKWYSRDTLFRGLSVLKTDYKGNIKKSPIKAYLYIVHTIIHEQGHEWINDCGKNCIYRPENKIVK